MNAFCLMNTSLSFQVWNRRPLKTRTLSKEAPPPPHDNYSSQFLAWITKVSALHPVQCKVQRKHRVTITAQWPWMRNLTSGLRFDREMWISRWPDFSKWMDQIFYYWLTLQWFLSESILEASISFHCYRNWKSIDAQKYGYDVSVRPSTHPTAEALWVHG